MILESDRTGITESMERILRHRDLSYLSREAYRYISLTCGSIVHFDIEGRRHACRDARDSLNFFLIRSEYGDCLANLPARRTCLGRIRKLLAQSSASSGCTEAKRSAS